MAKGSLNAEEIAELRSSPKAERDEDFTDLREQNGRKPAKETMEQTLASRVEQLEHEPAYTRQI